MVLMVIMAADKFILYTTGDIHTLYTAVMVT